MRRTESQAGVTLLETVVALGVAAIAVFFAARLMATTDRARVEVETRRETATDLDSLVDRLRNDVKKRRRLATPSPHVALPAELRAEPYLAFSDCVGRSCRRMQLARRFPDGLDRIVTYETACITAPASLPSFEPHATTFVEPCAIDCPAGKRPVIRITADEGPEAFPKGFRSAARSVAGMAICFSLPDTPVADWREEAIQIDASSAFVPRSGAVASVKRTFMAPVLPFLASGVE